MAQKEISHLSRIHIQEQKSFFRKHSLSILSDIYITWIKQERAEMRRDVDEMKRLAS